MPPRSAKHLQAMREEITSWRSPHRKEALAFVARHGERKVFELLHAMRRWYSGQTMARHLLANREMLEEVMVLDPGDVVGIVRGFKVEREDPLAHLQPGDRVSLPITRNHGMSSWALTEKIAHRFSGASKTRVGLVVALASERGVTPVLAPPSRTLKWFNGLYERVIGKSFRPNEGEYLLSGRRLQVVIVQVKR